MSLADTPDMRPMLFVLAGLAIAGCGTDVRPADEGSDAGAPGGGFVPPAGYARLIARRWEIPAGANVYKCVRVTVPADMYITSFAVQSPVGAHHGVLSIAKGFGTEGPDGEQDCTPSTIGRSMIYASAIGTDPLELPDGVGIHIPAGEQIHLNLHLYNASDEAITGESAIWVQASSLPPPTLAEMVLAGPLDISIPNDNVPHQVTGECTARNDYSLFAVWPHMHALGTAQKVELVHAASTEVIHDKPFNVDDQSYDLLRPATSVVKGEKIRVTCTYVNSTSAPVMFGDGAGNEMCFSGLYRYPAAGSDELCAD